jgi:hypothetical protein
MACVTSFGKHRSMANPPLSRSEHLIAKCIAL